MKRRRFIATAGTLGVTAAAGCLGNGGGTSTPTMTDATFTVQQIESGTEVDEAAVAFAAPTVTVDGTMLNQRENPGHQAGRESRTLR